MPKLVWDQTGARLYETGVSNGVIYPRNAAGAYPLGVPWNGLISVTESPGGAEATPLYADNVKYLNLLSAEELGASIEAYMYPPEFAKCDGSADLQTGVSIGQQPRTPFGLAYKTILGNDAVGNALGYKLHLIYNAQASPSEKAYSTINDSPEAITFSWELTTTPESVTGHGPTASIVIDSTKVEPIKLASFEDIIFGRDGAAGASIIASLPLPDAVGAHFAP